MNLELIGHLIRDPIFSAQCALLFLCYLPCFFPQHRYWSQNLLKQVSKFWICAFDVFIHRLVVLIPQKLPKCNEYYPLHWQIILSLGFSYHQVHSQYLRSTQYLLFASLIFLSIFLTSLNFGFFIVASQVFLLLSITHLITPISDRHQMFFSLEIFSTLAWNLHHNHNQMDLLCLSLQIIVHLVILHLLVFCLCL